MLPEGKALVSVEEVSIITRYVLVDADSTEEAISNARMSVGAPRENFSQKFSVILRRGIPVASVESSSTNPSSFLIIDTKSNGGVWTQSAVLYLNQLLYSLGILFSSFWNGVGKPMVNYKLVSPLYSEDLCNLNRIISDCYLTNLPVEFPTLPIFQAELG